MSEGPTTEGSIVAYLRLNDSDWNETLNAAETRARELGRADPTIKVHADVAEAQANLAAVRAAEKSLGNVGSNGGSGVAKIDQVTAAQNRLNAAEQAADVAYARAQLSAMRLDEVETKRGRTEREVAAAVLANTVAQQRLDAANQRATASEEALAIAKAQQAEAADRSTVAALREAAAVEADRNANDKANQSRQNSIGFMGMIVAGVAVAIPMMSQLAGATVGLAGGMAGLGAAGVLAILGIKNEMADGTAAGNEYAAGIQMIKADLQQLESTAANGVLDGFDRSLALINDSMPALNSEIRLFSSELGTAGGILTTGVITALRIMNPLFLQAGFYVQQLAAGFTHWTRDGGLRQFTQDAIVALPQVTQALGSLLHGVLSLIQAFSPLGPVLLGVITLLGNLMTLLGMLGPALPPIVAGAVAAFLMFMKWQAISPILENVAWRLGAVGLAADIASGPVGWIIGAASLLAIGLVGIATAAGDATKATQDYTAAVQQDNGVMGQSVEKQAADNLQKSGALALAKQLKISTQELTAATTTDDIARQKLIASLKEQIQEGTKVHAAGKAVVTTYTDQAKAAMQLLPILQDTHDSITNTIKAYNDVAQAQGQATISTRDQLNAAQQLAATYGISVPQMLAAEAAQKQNADQAAATTRQLQFENDAATLLTNAFTLLNGGTLDVAQAQTGAAAAANTLLDSLKQNGPVVDGNTKAAVANQQALQQKVQADQQAAEAIAKQTGSTQAGTAAFAASRQALIDQLRATGELTPAIQALIDKYYAVPPVVKTRAELDADAAKAKADALKASLDQIARDWTAQVHIVTTGTMPTAGHLAAQASGGPAGAQYLATGGFGWRSRGTDTIPAVLSPGEFVVKEKSASYDPQFMKAYNDDPARALASVGGQQNITVEVINKTGMTLSDLIDIRVRANNQRQKAGIQAGIQEVAL
ncbi:hypothetical protein [Leifsonia sp. TF02-11]|uniref:hypothetical protein n=1 Tax=Leifsonia sp. TF02-11 TaxID=2815212 RepID=UPI001AA12544|nr:hypothetical protein [Leifsonia sp. TF02-11]MBO1739664.1 hypothetical protein [Leifsonia sp. TF02-11]